jgi:hypothetical protein
MNRIKWNLARVATLAAGDVIISLHLVAKQQCTTVDARIFHSPKVMAIAEGLVTVSANTRATHQGFVKGEASNALWLRSPTRCPR